MASETTSPPKQSNRPLHSCVRCSDRKVKCDRADPCGACVKHNAECVYRPFPPPKRRPNRVKENILNDKLKRYEAIFREQGIDPHQIQHPSEAEQQASPNGPEPTRIEHLQLPTPGSTSTYSEPERAITKTQLVHGLGRSQFLDNGLWSRVVEELHDPQDVLDESDDESDGDVDSCDDFDFTLGITPRSTSRHPHPSTEVIDLLWLTFTENVDPLTKIVHAPTMQGALQKATADIASVPRGFEALMFAMYSIAVLSLTDNECRQKFGQSRKTLLSHYVSATKAALSRARFMSTTSIVVLQALILHIFCIRDFYEPRAVWILTGVAIRIAEGMGIHQDGASWGLPPFEVEIRRRVWWQLKMHDFRTAELSGLAKFQGIGTGVNAPQAPTNVNDSDIYPGMTSPPTPLTGSTDMIYCALKCELGAMHAEKVRKQAGVNWLWNANASTDEITAKEEVLLAVEEALETRFVRYCDPTQPLHLMAMILVRTAINIGRFVTHHPRRWEHESLVPESERHLVWNLSIKILEQYEVSQSNPQLQPFRWYSYYFLPWHAFIHVLDTLRSQPLMKDAARAWRLVEATYNNNSTLMTNNRPLHVVVGNLCLKAFNARESAAPRDKGTSITPYFIQQLRQAREAAMTQRLARVSRESKHSNGSSGVHRTGMNQGDTKARSDSINALSEMNLQPRNIQQNMVLPGTFQYPASYVNDDMLWFTDGLENSVPVAAPGVAMTVDTDLMLAQGYGSEDSPGQAINWTQWDAWLGSVNSMAANPMMTFDNNAAMI